MCFRKFNNAVDETTLLRCGLRCGATFCDRRCYVQFLMTRATQHGVLCQSRTGTLRQIVSAAKLRGGGRGKHTRAQWKAFDREFVKLEAWLEKGDAIVATVAKSDLLMVRLLLCEAAWRFDDTEFCGLAFHNCAMVLEELLLLDQALLFFRQALAVAKRRVGENRSAVVGVSFLVAQKSFVLFCSEKFAQCLRSIANVLSDLSRYEDAKRLLYRALLIAQRINRNSELW
jgi:tetratricopeptide (TPR) repeat protein